jgi:hypothetical protein
MHLMQSLLSNSGAKSKGKDEVPFVNGNDNVMNNNTSDNVVIADAGVSGQAPEVPIN